MSSIDGTADVGSVSALGATCFQLAARLRDAEASASDEVDVATAGEVSALVAAAVRRLEDLGQAAQQLAGDLADADALARRGVPGRAAEAGGRAHARFVRDCAALVGHASGG